MKNRSFILLLTVAILAGGVDAGAQGLIFSRTPDNSSMELFPKRKPILGGPVKIDFDLQIFDPDVFGQIMVFERGGGGDFPELHIPEQGNVLLYPQQPQRQVPSAGHNLQQVFADTREMAACQCFCDSFGRDGRNYACLKDLLSGDSRTAEIRAFTGVFRQQ